MNSLNWRNYLTPEDVERECILESYGYKMIRVNRFNMGKDPVSSLDQKLKDLIDEYVNVKKSRNNYQTQREDDREHSRLRKENTQRM